jgi:hypothetical protein
MNPVVHPFIMPADEQEVGVAGQLPGLGLIELRPRGTEQDNPGLGVGLPRRPDGRHQRLDFHDHAGAAAEGPVVRHLVPVVGIVPQVHHPVGDRPLGLGPVEHALA